MHPGCPLATTIQGSRPTAGDPDRWIHGERERETLLPCSRGVALFLRTDLRRKTQTTDKNCCCARWYQSKQQYPFYHQDEN